MTKTTKQPLQERLLQAGVEELYQHGIENFSVRRIATACGVSCAAPYKHFSDKNAFVTAIFDHVNNQWLALEENLAHGGQPVLRWMMDNIYIRTDPAGNIKPEKEKSTEKIDGAVATIMALDRAIRCGNDKSASVYDSRGILFL